MSESENFISTPQESIYPNMDYENWSEGERENWYGLYKTLLEIDLELNPQFYTRSVNPKSYESNPNIRNSNNTSQA